MPRRCRRERRRAVRSRPRLPCCPSWAKSSRTSSRPSSRRRPRCSRGRAGGGAVRVRATGGLEFQEVSIDPSVVDPADIDLLQDLILAALRDVVEQAHAEAAQALGGLDVGGGLGGLLGP